LACGCAFDEGHQRKERVQEKTAIHVRFDLLVKVHDPITIASNVNGGTGRSGRQFGY